MATLRSLRVVRLAFLLATCLVVASPLWAAPPPASASGTSNLRADMRKLWEDHITWTRLFIVSALADLPDKDATTKRLLQNQVDIGNAIKPFFGNEAGDKLSALLKDHILIAADIVTAAKANDTPKLESSKTRWVANADEISAFLSGANPKYWPPAEMKAMMREHLDVTTTELMARLNTDWAADVAAYEKVHAQILHMADMLADGIAGKFPDKVK